MDLKVAAAFFSSNGGGGGGFYFGRGQQEQEREEREAAPEPGEMGHDALRWTHRDRGTLQAGLPSRMRLSLPPAAVLEEPAAEDEVDLAALEAELQGKLRVLAFGLGRLEQAYQRRLQAQVGEMLVS